MESSPLVSQDSILIRGQLTPVLPGIKYLMEVIVDTCSIFGVASTNSGNWNGATLVRVLILFADL